MITGSNPVGWTKEYGVVAKWQSVQTTGQGSANPRCKAATITGSNPVGWIKEYGVVAKWQGKGLQNPD
ncbi:MAG TPA: hypothetical protein PKM21_17370, partial [Anaerolineales bacterium]|nr:hypothetical protein [Anaerolineales bacterium]